MTSATDSDRFPIGYAARMAGLTTHTVRMWERRYNAVEPVRTDTNRRLYTREHIKRLSLMRSLSERGHSVSKLAACTTEKLEELDRESAPQRIVTKAVLGDRPADLLRLCQHAVNRMDGAELGRTLDEALVKLSVPVLLDEVLAPLVRWIGTCWEQGALRVAHEHMASGVIQEFLAAQRRTGSPDEHAPRIVIATPASQVHELGAQMAALTAYTMGWRVDYFGASMPAQEIAAAVQQNQARAVGLSIVLPNDLALLIEELTRLRAALAPGFPILVGGAGIGALAPHAPKLKLRLAPTLSALRDALRELRSAPAAGLT